MKLLVVEDMEDARLLLVDQLSAIGHQVDFATDGLEALDYLHNLQNSRPDVIVSDILMPNMDGYELCKAIKNSKEFSSIPVVFYTATYTDQSDKEFALSLGASGFLVKPAREEELVDLIESVVEKLPQMHISNSSSINENEYNYLHSITLSKKLDKRDAELFLQKEQLRIITDALPVLIAEVNTNHEYTYANKTHEQWCKISPASAIGAPMPDVVGANVYRTIKKFLDTGKEHRNREMLLPFPDGNERHLYSHFIPIKNNKGLTVRFVILLTDVTLLKRSQLELSLYKKHLEELVEQRTAQLESSNRELEVFGYTVSHDLRNPLNSIKSYCTLLAEELKNKNYGELDSYIEEISNLSSRMGSMIEDLLNLSRISKKSLNYEEVNLSDLSANVYQELCKTTQANVDIHIAKNLKILGDIGLLRVVMENLIGNALKFTNKTESPSITIDGYKSENNRVFFVKDNGSGFDPRYQNKLFLIFQRLHRSNEFPGTGIGLATVKKIIERHAGKVWASGAIGKGATIFFSLPINVPNSISAPAKPSEPSTVESIT